MIDLYDNYYAEGPERCGLILDDFEVIETQNVHPEPDKGFEVDPEAIVKYDGKIIGTWHTHPNQSSILSQEDHACFSLWDELSHYIVGSDGVRKYVVMDGAVIDADYTPR